MCGLSLEIEVRPEVAKFLAGDVMTSGAPATH
jgi:hypothetical protein